MPVVTLDRVSMAFGHLPLLEGVSLQVEAGERVCLIGRNGSGKSTLLQIINGDMPPDGGTVWQQPGTRVARLVQDVPLSDTRAVFDVVADGLGDLSDLVMAYHHAAVAVTEDPSEAALERLGRLQHTLEERDGWRLEQRVEVVVARLGLPSEAVVDTLSGGWRRRVLLARALVAQPDLLLLDEPTNHLDLDAIAWLEDFLADYAGAVMFVTHDRAFLQRLATRIVELDRGVLTSWPGDYATFLRKKEEWLANEALLREKFDKKLAGEEAWLRQGVKARRTRDEGRVKALMAMRQDRAERREQDGAVRMQIESADPSGRMVFEARGISKTFGQGPVVQGFSCRVMRGDRVGLIGPNGAGKTTLLRLLLEDIAPDEGAIRHGANVQVAYYDQQREQLDPDRTVFDTIGDGNETVTVNGRSRHVNGYLADFLFPPERAQSPVRALSGGERNRLLLARLFTRAANVLVLDEPTNDLDIDSLELLEAQLAEFPGTLLLVSHDRQFLDNAVTSTFVFEGGGRVREYVGGYTDWIRQRAAPTAVPEQERRGEARRSPSPGNRAKAGGGPAAPKLAKTIAGGPAAPKLARASEGGKLSFNEQREFDRLPGRIEALETELRELGEAVAHPGFYRTGADAIAQVLARLETVQQELHAVYARWDALDSRL
jgi:ATP-binding cassette subfamily F protein uup